MLFLGEIFAKLENEPDPKVRMSILRKNSSVALKIWFQAMNPNIKWRSCLKGREALWSKKQDGSDVSHGWTASNLHREAQKLRMFAEGEFNYIPDDKFIDLFDKTLLKLHRSEATAINDLINGRFKMKYQPEEEISLYLRGI